jgi:hypothetical protein
MLIRAVRALVLLGGLAAGEGRAAAFEHFVGTLTVQVFPMPALTVSGEGIAQLDPELPPLVSLRVPGSAFTGRAGTTLPTFHSLFHPIREIGLTVANGAGTLAGGGGALPLRGLYRACLFALCDTAPYAAQIPLTAGGTRGVGLGGSHQLSDPIFHFTVRGAPWTLGRVEVTTPYGGIAARTGFVHAPSSGTDFASVARHGGALQMVTPFFIDTVSRDGTTSWLFGGVATLHAVFAPEPGTAALLLAGVAGLAAHGRAARAQGR